MYRLLLIVLNLFLLTLTACADGGGDDAAASAVEAFWNAKIAGDAEALQGLMCAAMERDVEMQATSFDSVEAEIEGMACTSSVEGDEAVVTCEGQIVATYGTEVREFPLGISLAVQEDGEWKWCGEAASEG